MLSVCVGTVTRAESHVLYDFLFYICIYFYLILSWTLTSCVSINICLLFCLLLDIFLKLYYLFNSNVEQLLRNPLSHGMNKVFWLKCYILRNRIYISLFIVEPRFLWTIHSDFLRQESMCTDWTQDCLFPHPNPPNFFPTLHWAQTSLSSPISAATCPAPHSNPTEESHNELSSDNLVTLGFTALL